MLLHEKDLLILYKKLVSVSGNIMIRVMFEYLNHTINIKSAFIKFSIFGGIIFGVNLIFFNFFCATCFKSRYLDLIIRTLIDIVSVIIGYPIINVKESKVLIKVN
jgi:hypothetical protein